MVAALCAPAPLVPPGRKWGNRGIESSIQKSNGSLVGQADWEVTGSQGPKQHWLHPLRFEGSAAAAVGVLVLAAERVVVRRFEVSGLPLDIAPLSIEVRLPALESARAPFGFHRACRHSVEVSTRHVESRPGPRDHSER